MLGLCYARVCLCVGLEVNLAVMFRRFARSSVKQYHDSIVYVTLRTKTITVRQYRRLAKILDILSLCLLPVAREK